MSYELKAMQAEHLSTVASYSISCLMWTGFVCLDQCKSGISANVNTRKDFNVNNIAVLGLNRTHDYRDYCSYERRTPP